MKFVAGLIGGLILAILALLLASMLTAGASDDPTVAVAAFLGAWVVAMIVALTAPKASKAWRRLMIMSAIASFLLPLSGLFYTGAYIANQTNDGIEVAGAALGGTMLSGALGFVGFFLGVIFLIIGLLVGRDKQVIIVHQAPAA